MAQRYARCGGKNCRKFFKLSEVDRAGCPCCDYRTARCENCGGQEGALRSVFCHMAYWRTRGNMDGGHVEKMRRLADEITARTIRRVESRLGLH